MALYLLILASILAVVNILRSRQLTHVVLFSMGFLYYWMLPPVVGLFPPTGGSWQEEYAAWLDLFRDISSTKLTIYACSALVYYLSFRLGDGLAAWVGRSRKRKWSPRMNFINLLYIVALGLGFAMTYQLRGLIGKNYGEIGEAAMAKGTLTAVSLAILSLALLKTASQERASFLRTISNRWMLGYLLVAIALLGMGERLYFASSLLLCFSYRSIFFRSYTRTQLFTAGSLLGLLGGVVGVIRMGSNLSPAAFVVNLGAEPVLTSFSLISFLKYNQLPWVEWPKLLASSFLNLVPSAILSNKVDMLADPTSVGYSYISPAGAFHSWVSFVINFGLIGSAPVLFLFGYFLRRLLMNATTPLIKTQYLMCSAFIVFTCFRDPFSVSLVKNVFEFSLLVPAVCMTVSDCLTWIVEREGTWTPTSDVLSKPNRY